MDTFWNVDVSEVIENNHSKENGNRNQDTNNLCQWIDHSADLQFKVVVLNNTVNIWQVDEFGCHIFNILLSWFSESNKVGIIHWRCPKSFLVVASIHKEEMPHVHFSDTSYLNLGRLILTVLHSNGISNLEV